MNKRVLIVCEAIAPPAFSPRVITLVEGLLLKGWHCEIVTEMDNNQPLDLDICAIHQMPTYHHLIADKLFGAKEKALVRFARERVDIDKFDRSTIFRGILPSNMMTIAEIASAAKLIIFLQRNEATI